MKKRIMVDMSATLIHHGHIRLLQKASEYGSVIVGLTSDKEIIFKKGYEPELTFENRKEILQSITYVDEVVETPWLIDENILDEYKIDFLVHGDDNSNIIDSSKIKIFPRTKGISSSMIRESVLQSITSINNKKLMLTPGPAVVLKENLQHLKPLFGRGDDEYTKIVCDVTEWIKELSGQDNLMIQQGSSTLSLELAAHSFVKGKVLIVSTGYYSDRLELLLPQDCDVTLCKYEDVNEIQGRFDWVLCAYTETSTAFKLDINLIKEKTTDLGARLYVDATGSIGLEENHHLADVMAFSSCKGLFGLTGASFIAYKNDLIPKTQNLFYFNMETQINKMVTGPYHAIASLYGVMKNHTILKNRVKKSKKATLEKWSNLTRDNKNQPLLCTYIEGQIAPKDEDIVLYSPRSKLSGSVICHFGEIHMDEVYIDQRIEVVE